MAGTYILTDYDQPLLLRKSSRPPIETRAVVVTARETARSQKRLRHDVTRSAKRRSPRSARCRACPLPPGAVSTRATLLTTSGKRITGTAPSIVDAVQPARFEAFNRSEGYLPRAADENGVDRRAPQRRQSSASAMQLVIRGQRSSARYTISGDTRSSLAANPSAARSVALLLPAQAQVVAGEPANTTASTSPRARDVSPETACLARCRRACRQADRPHRDQEAANQTSELEEKLGFLKDVPGWSLPTWALLVGRVIISTPCSSPVATAHARVRPAAHARRPRAPDHALGRRGRADCWESPDSVQSLFRGAWPRPALEWAVQGIRRRTCPTTGNGSWRRVTVIVSLGVPGIADHGARRLLPGDAPPHACRRWRRCRGAAGARYRRGRFRPADAV